MPMKYDFLSQARVGELSCQVEVEVPEISE